MKFLVLLKPTPSATPEQFKPHMIPEMEAVWQSYRKGLLREIYFAPSQPPVITLIYEAADAVEVNRDLDALPMVEAGLLGREVVQLNPFLQLESIFNKTLVNLA